MKRLNASEREVIVKKIVNKIYDNYDKKCSEIKKTYIPSEKYRELEEGLKVIEDTLNKILPMWKESARNVYLYPYAEKGFHDVLQEVLDGYRDTEITLPEYPCIDKEEIKDDLVLSGIDEFESVQQIIDSYVAKYNV